MPDRPDRPNIISILHTSVFPLPFFSSLHVRQMCAQCVKNADFVSHLGLLALSYGIDCILMVDGNLKYDVCLQKKCVYRHVPSVIKPISKSKINVSTRYQLLSSLSMSLDNIGA